MEEVVRHKCNKLSWVILLVLSIATTGCGASGPLFARMPSRPGKAVAYVYRLHGMFGGAVSWDLFANGEYITRVTNGGYFGWEVDSGEMELTQLGEVSPVLLGHYLLSKALNDVEPLYKFQAVAGKEYFLKWHINFTAPELVPADANVALDEMRSLRMFEDMRAIHDSGAQASE